MMTRFKPKTSHRVIETIADKLRELPSLIKEIQGFSVQTDLGLDPARNHDLAAVALFDSAEDYEVYATHPAHLEVIKLAIVPILAPGGRSAVQIPFNPDRAEKEAVKTEHVQTTTIMSRMYDLPLLILYAYFIFSCTMIETSYCAGDGPMDPSDTTFMMPETYDFSTKYDTFGLGLCLASSLGLGLGLRLRLCLIFTIVIASIITSLSPSPSPLSSSSPSPGTTHCFLRGPTGLNWPPASLRKSGHHSTTHQQSSITSPLGRWLAAGAHAITTQLRHLLTVCLVDAKLGLMALKLETIGT